MNFWVSPHKESKRWLEERERERKKKKKTKMRKRGRRVGCDWKLKSEYEKW
jgi:hypothetical protein